MAIILSCIIFVELFSVCYLKLSVSCCIQQKYKRIYISTNKWFTIITTVHLRILDHHILDRHILDLHRRRHRILDHRIMAHRILDHHILALRRHHISNHRLITIHRLHRRLYVPTTLRHLLAFSAASYCKYCKCAVSIFVQKR